MVFNLSLIFRKRNKFTRRINNNNNNNNNNDNNNSNHHNNNNNNINNNNNNEYNNSPTFQSLLVVLGKWKKALDKGNNVFRKILTL